MTHKALFFILLWVGTCLLSHGQPVIPLPESLPQEHPRLLTTPEGKKTVQALIKKETWAQDVMKGINGRIGKYVAQHKTDPEWMVSRLQMYWKTKSTNVYIKGAFYSHADGEAPVPTVRYSGSRDHTTIYGKPALEDILPYMDDPRGLYLPNNSREGKPFEWADPAKAGKQVEAINREIIGLARDAAFVHWLTGDARYATFAFDIFDTYITGMYYRSEPVDITNSHIQTLVGLSSFEVIQEGILTDLAILYDFLYPYLKANHAPKLDIYTATFKKWIDLTIKNGVPQNNWNLIQAKFILRVAMILEDNKTYADGKGREYYIDYILNRSSARQWSLTRLMDYGYDATTGVWAECPGYSQNVTTDFTNFIRDFDITFGMNLLPYMPVMEKAVKMLPQYTFPNGLISSFGDTHYGPVRTEAIRDMIVLAQSNRDKTLETEFTAMYKLFEPNAERGNETPGKMSPQITSLFAGKPLVLNPKVPAGKADDYITQTFYAPNVSWFVQRNGRDPNNGLMISQVASLGNHAHANGVSIELYGKGYVLGAESGIGSSYFQPPYKEYYSQFPAHNTVMVDGISSYPEMLSHHAFDLLACYPEPGRKGGYFPGITFSDVYFLEPESQSDQNRLLSIIRTSPSTGYYVDIFRSRKQRRGDKFHDYFYHNLGREMTVTSADGRPLDLQPSQEMAFAGGHLFALDYMWDKKSTRISEDYRAVWKMAVPDGNHVYMNLWMRGYPGREVFSIKAPPAEAYRGNPGLPYEADKAPFLTIAARQHGEAWTKPFVSVFEPATEKEGSGIESITSFGSETPAEDFVGIIVKHKTGRTDYIFSPGNDEPVTYKGMKVKATYAVVSELPGGDFVIFMGHGSAIQAKGYTFTANDASLVLERRNGEVYFTCDAPVTMTNEEGRLITLDQRDYSKLK